MNMDVQLKCPKCGESTLEHQQYDFSQYQHLTPVQDITGRTDYAISMQYQCSCCKGKWKSTNGELYNQLQSHFQQAYPVDPRYTSFNRHLTLTKTCIMEKLMVTYGNGDQPGYFMS
jgi:hypothetical protein